MLALALVACAVPSPSDPAGLIDDAEAPGQVHGTVTMEPAWIVAPPEADGTDGPRCWTVGGQQKHMTLLEADMDGGTWHEVGRYLGSDEPFFNAAGLGVVGDHVYMGLYGEEDGHWLDVDVRTGAGTFAGSAYHAAVLFSDGAHLFAVNNRELEMCEYADFAALSADTPESCTSRPYAEQFGWAGPRGIVGAWHSGSTVEFYDAVTHDLTGQTVLDDWDTWILGVSVVDNTVFVIDDGRAAGDEGRGRIAGFDIDSGERVSEVFVPRSDNGSTPMGLVCFPSP